VNRRGISVLGATHGDSAVSPCFGAVRAGHRYRAAACVRASDAERIPGHGGCSRSSAASAAGRCADPRLAKLITATEVSRDSQTLAMERQGRRNHMLTSRLSLCAGLLETLIDCSGGTVINEEAGAARKLDALQRVLRKVPTLRTVVFCNKIETCRKVCMLVLGALHHAAAARHTSRLCSSEAAVVAACSMTVRKRVQAIHQPCNTSFVQVENGLLRSQPDLRILAYHAAISDDRRTANLQVLSLLADPAVPHNCAAIAR